MAQSGKKGTNTHGLDKFACKGAKMLQKLVITNVTMKEINAWIAKNLTKGQAKAIMKTVAEVKEKAQTNIPEDAARMEALRLTLIEHGMPVVLAAKIDKESAYKLIAALHVKDRD